MAAAWLPGDFSRACWPLDLSRQRTHWLERGRGISMGLVGATRALILQQAAGHRVHPMGGHVAFRRHGFRRALFLAALRRDFKLARAAFHGARNWRTRGVLPAAQHLRHAAARSE